MSSKAVSEFFGKELLYKHLQLTEVDRPDHTAVKCNEKGVVDWPQVLHENKWIAAQKKVVIKPDQLIKRRGKLGLVGICTPNAVPQWLAEKMATPVQVGRTSGHLNTFHVEPFVEFSDNDEKYLAIYSERNRDVILFHHEGGVNIGDVDAKAERIYIDVTEETMEPTETQVNNLIAAAPKQQHKLLSQFIIDIYRVYKELYFTYLELNPFVMKNDKIYILDCAAKLDETAMFECHSKWIDRNGDKVDFPPPFGRELSSEESAIADLDAKTGASLKLTILNRRGRVWLMVAGGGASVIFSDTVCDMGGASELANYGEYSGDPSETQTYEYAKCMLSIMTEDEPREDGKVLIIGGSIANFTNVAKTFKGIIRALEEFKFLLQEHKVQIYVRRGGPNYQGGLRMMKETGNMLGVPLFVYGPETHMTAVVGAALGKTALPDHPQAQAQTTNVLLSTKETDIKNDMVLTPTVSRTPSRANMASAGDATELLNGAVDEIAKLFTEDTKAIVWGQQMKAVQGMLDFDFACSRKRPSVVATTYPFAPDHKQKYYFGHKEILVPSFKSMSDAVKKNPDASVVVSFASMRSVYETTREALNHPQIRTIAIIAEGVPENHTRKLIKMAKERGVAIIGPATVGGIKPGCFKIGNTGGMMDNILSCKLYRPGSVAYVSRSGGMSNELNNIINQNTDGVYEGVAIGGDRYPGSTYVDHIRRYQADDNVKMMVMLGEVGGTLEYDVVEALRNGAFKKPLVAWCIGTCADHITSEVQFGHAGASANAEREKAAMKNAALRKAGAVVPDSFNDLGVSIRKVFVDLKEKGRIPDREEPPPPAVPVDYAWAAELGLIRKPAAFMTSMTDERGEELLYAGTPISKVLESGMGIGDVLALLWFQRRLPDYASQFLEMCLILTADHGPAVSGAHNTIICARAGKDLVSSLVSGLLTIGDRFGGALDGAARMFSDAYDCGLSPMDFVNKTRKEGKLIMGIGHRVKSLNNPDKRVEILKQFAKDKSKFKQPTPLFEFAQQVELITTTKKPNLILNVDGAIAVLFVDILRESGSFTKEESREIIDNGALNGLFVLGRSMGFIGHYLDQKRLKQGLYRHPWDDITYIIPEDDKTA